VHGAPNFLIGGRGTHFKQVKEERRDNTKTKTKTAKDDCSLQISGWLHHIAWIIDYSPILPLGLGGGPRGPIARVWVT